MRTTLVVILLSAFACSETEEDPGPRRDLGEPVGTPRDQGAAVPDGGEAMDLGDGDRDLGAMPRDLGVDAGAPDGGGGPGPVSYDFVKITDSNTSDASVGGVEPTVDGAGRVAWRTIADGPSAQVRVGDGTGPEQVLYDAATSMEPLAFINIQRPRFNQGGRLVAQIETTGFVDAIVTGDGGPFTLIASEGDEPTFGNFSLNAPPEIADDGQVAFGDRSGEIWIGDGSARPVAQVPDDLELFGRFRLLASGRILLTARPRDAPEDVLARLRGADDFEVLLRETELPDGLVFSGRNAAAPDGQLVAFGVRQAGNPGAEGVSVIDAGGLRTLVEPSEALTPIQTIEVNAGGAVVFISGTAGQPSRAIRRGPGPEDVVIAIGDALFGSTVTVLGFARAGLNDAGQIAFAYCTELECGIARADPRVD